MAPIGNAIGKVTVVELNDERAVFQVVNENVFLKISTSNVESNDALRKALVAKDTDSANKIKALQEACLCYLQQNESVNQQLDLQKTETANEKKRSDHAEGLLAALLAIFAIYVRFHEMGLAFLGGWLTVACFVYLRRLRQNGSKLLSIVWGSEFVPQFKRVLGRMRF